MRLFSKKRPFLGENCCLLMFIDVYRCFHILLHALGKVLGCLVVPFACKLSFRVGVISIGFRKATIIRSILFAYNKEVREMYLLTLRDGLHVYVHMRTTSFGAK